jgi:hypothetical protein
MTTKEMTAESFAAMTKGERHDPPWYPHHVPRVV